MAKTLQLVFQTATGKRMTISVDEPNDNLSEDMVQAAATDVIDALIFTVDGDPLHQILSAQIVERNVTDILKS